MNQRSNHKQVLKKTTEDWCDDISIDSLSNSYRKICYKFKDDDTINTVELTRFQYENFKILPIIEYCKIEKILPPKISEQFLMEITTS